MARVVTISAARVVGQVHRVEGPLEVAIDPVADRQIDFLVIVPIAVAVGDRDRQALALKVGLNGLRDRRFGAKQVALATVPQRVERVASTIDAAGVQGVAAEYPRLVEQHVLQVFVVDAEGEVAARLYVPFKVAVEADNSVLAAPTPPNALPLFFLRSTRMPTTMLPQSWSHVPIA